SHGLATSLVVLARTMGMLLGLSALTAFGLYRFRQILGTPVLHGDLAARIQQLEDLVSAAFLQEYREIFLVAAGLCGAAAMIIVLSLRRSSTSGDT
ncbi:MAG TPA: MFS transporter, partial [Candidatus Dormibacteraeota bacterium]